MPGNNAKNLIPQAHTLTVEEQSKGGIRSAEVRQERKKAREIAEVVLSMPLKKGKGKSLDDINSLSEVDNTDTLTALIVNATHKALGGSYRHLELILTLTGDYSRKMQLQMPQHDVDGSMKRLKEIMAYHDEEDMKETTAKAHVCALVNKLLFAIKSPNERYRTLKDIPTEELETLLQEIYDYGIKQNEHFGEPIDKGGLIDYIRDLIQERHLKECSSPQASTKKLSPMDELLEIANGEGNK